MQPSSDQKRPWDQRATYWCTREFCRVTGVLAYRIRCYGSENFPAQGGALICANHQSNLDPPVIGMCCPRRMNFLAKKSLFKYQPFKWFISTLDAIPLDLDGLGLSGIKETLKRLKRGELVLMFPEGQRCWDGEVGPLLPGFTTLARRTKVPLVPVGIDGAFQAWPRTHSIPKPGCISIDVGKAIAPSEYADLEESQLIEMLNSRITSCFQKARNRRHEVLTQSRTRRS